MAVKGSINDASGEKINSFRIVTDGNATTGIGDSLDPIRVDPTGTTVQPVSFASAQHVIIDSGGGGGTQYADGAVQATPTGTVALGKNPSNVLTSVPITAAGAVKTDSSATTQPVSGTVSVSNFPATQPVSGTVTANIGSSGSLALDASVTGLQVAQSSTTAGEKGTLAQGAVTTAAPVYVTTQTSPLSLNTAGGLRVDGSGVTQPVSGTITTTPPSNASTNVAQVAGTATDTNSGLKSAGTLRIVLATDQPALTNKLLVTPDSVALPANQSVNVSQINAITPLMGNGITGTGSQRVTIASDNTAFAVNATLSAETTKVIGTVNVAASQTIAVTQATAASLNATVVLATGTATIGSVKITDGTTVPGVIVATTALKTDLSSVAGTATVTAAAGVQKVGIVGNTGATIDAAVGTLPTNNQAAIIVPTTGATAAYTTKFINASGAAVNIKASAGNLYGFSITNETAAIAYIELFNIATTPVLGTTVVAFAVKLPASANITLSPSAIALMNFTTGIGYACTTTENGVTAASTTGMIFYL